MKKSFSLNRRGISTVIGGILMINIIIIGLSALFWQTQQNYSYQQMVQKKADDDFLRTSEDIKITHVEVDNNKLNVTVFNEGSISTHLVSLYITNYANGIPQWHNFSSIDYRILPAMSLYGVGSSLSINFQQDGIYGILVGTERGNIASFVYGLEHKTVGKAQPLTFTFDIRSFNFTRNNYAGDPLQTKTTPAWVLNGSGTGTKKILLWLKCINNGAKDVILSKYSYFFVEVPFPSPDGQHSYEYERYFFIVNNASTSGTVISYSDYSQVIPANQTDYATGTTRIVKFGASQIGGNSLSDWDAPYTSNWSQSTYGTTSPAFSHQYYTYILVYWKYSGDSQIYSQFVPYALIWVR